MFPLKEWDKFRTGYRFRQLTFYCKHHLGIDKICKCGTDILMPFNGRIKKLHGTMGGNTIWIYPDDQNIIIRILHCQDIKQSGRYQEGDIIGWVGSTGLSTACHTHLDISRHRVNIWDINNFIDPETFDFKKGNIMVDEKLLEKIYQELLMRSYDVSAVGYLGKEENEVRKAVGKSKERMSIIDLVNKARQIN